MSEWTKVSDALPEKEGLYIVLEIYSSEMVEHFDRGKYIPADDEVSGLRFDGGSFVSYVNGCDYSVETVTHWMEFPE